MATKYYSMPNMRKMSKGRGIVTKILKSHIGSINGSEDVISSVQKKKSELSGLCAVYKPKGLSSASVVAKIKYILQSYFQENMKQKCKIKVLSSIWLNFLKLSGY